MPPSHRREVVHEHHHPLFLFCCECYFKLACQHRLPLSLSHKLTSIEARGRARAHTHTDKDTDTDTYADTHADTDTHTRARARALASY
jgi:hypothetical protein